MSRRCPPGSPTGHVTTLADGSAESLADRFDTALLDLDGVVYVGPHAVDGVPETLAEVRRRGMRTAFVTNNAARTPETVAAHLRELGVAAEADDVVTSAQAAATLVLGRVGAGAAVLVVGGEGLRAALIERGLRPVTSADDADAVVQGFAPDVDWRALAEGTFAVRRGLPWIACQPGQHRADSAGHGPRQRCARRRHRADHRASRRRGGRQAGAGAAPGVHAAHRGPPDPLVVGDRLDTDIEGANRAGVASLLVFTGVATPADVVRAEPVHRPTYVAADLRAGLLEAHPPVTRDERGWTCGAGHRHPGRRGAAEPASTRCAQPASPPGRARSTSDPCRRRGIAALGS